MQGRRSNIFNKLLINFNQEINYRKINLASKMQENDFLLQKHHDNKENNARWVIKIIKNQDKHIKVTLAKGFPYPVCVAHI